RPESENRYRTFAKHPAGNRCGTWLPTHLGRVQVRVWVKLLLELLLMLMLLLKAKLLLRGLLVLQLLLISFIVHPRWHRPQSTGSSLEVVGCRDPALLCALRS